ncbi:MAG TPA: hypothetical protein VMQ61_04170 [Thermoanaerobaculia bacterium]|nr:hypothetical protein [Thermoanaerobaculia bacterium]
MNSRREVLESGMHACLGAAGLAMLAAGTGTASAAETQEASEKPSPQRFLLVGLCGSENPTRSNFPFVWAAALHQAGHEVRIELAGDGTVMMRTPVANNVTAVGWPPFREALARVIDLKIPIYV